MDNKQNNFIQSNSPDGGFLQSVYWRKFQESVGRETYYISASDGSEELIAFANIIEHKLPIAGKYFYVPRGPVLNYEIGIRNYEKKIIYFFRDLVNLAKEKNIGWIRVEPANESILKIIRENLPKGIKMKKAAVDMQPKEILMIDISGSEEDILARMKPKTRYNIRLAEKRGVHAANNTRQVARENIEDFLRLVKITAKRDKITAHPEDYYRKMFEAIPPDILKLYIAEFEGKTIAANLVLFFGKTATYMHGASDNESRSVMAPYLLQWQQILGAKKRGCEKYDFGGVKTQKLGHITRSKNNWSGITKFKTGFAPETRPVEFPGCYDIILDSKKYNLYRILQKVKRIF